MEVQCSLAFSHEERREMSALFTFGDAEEQLSYAVDQFGSARVASLINESNNDDIGVLALEEVDGFNEAERQLIEEMIGRHGRHVYAYSCRKCGRIRYCEVNPRLCHGCLSGPLDKVIALAPTEGGE